MQRRQLRHHIKDAYAALRAEAEWKRLIAHGNGDQVAEAAFNLGFQLASRHDISGVRAAYSTAIKSGHPEFAPRPARNLGLLLEEARDLDSARAAYEVAIESGHHDESPAAGVNLAIMLKGVGDVAGARAACLTSCVLPRAACLRLIVRPGHLHSR